MSEPDEAVCHYMVDSSRQQTHSGSFHELGRDGDPAARDAILRQRSPRGCQPRPLLRYGAAGRDDGRAIGASAIGSGRSDGDLTAACGRGGTATEQAGCVASAPGPAPAVRPRGDCTMGHSPRRHRSGCMAGHGRNRRVWPGAGQDAGPTILRPSAAGAAVAGGRYAPGISGRGHGPSSGHWHAHGCVAPSRAMPGASTAAPRAVALRSGPDRARIRRPPPVADHATRPPGGSQP
jgi:hypothetical protein